MLNQGEKGNFKGHFQQLIGGSWSYVISLSGFKIKAMVVNERKNRKFLFSTDSSESGIDGVISIEDDTVTKDGKTISCQCYTFTLTSAMTKQMLGECTMEIALIDSSDNILITDTKGRFVVNDSLLGRTI